jgi:XTP/dITP diphosphohydrolase
MSLHLLVATTNRGKLQEFQGLLSDFPITWHSLADLGLDKINVAETEDSFEGNALLKARVYAQASGMTTLADDSGLMIDALGGAPGVYSARYGWPHAKTDSERYQKVLAELSATPPAERGARFVCVIAVVKPNGDSLIARGELVGVIGYEARGTYGFGYDPIFVLADGRHLAELPPDEKQAISHRGLALRALDSHLLGWLG